MLRLDLHILLLPLCSAAGMIRSNVLGLNRVSALSYFLFRLVA